MRGRLGGADPPTARPEYGFLLLLHLKLEKFSRNLVKLSHERFGLLLGIVSYAIKEHLWLKLRFIASRLPSILVHTIFLPPHLPLLLPLRARSSPRRRPGLPTPLGPWTESSTTTRRSCVASATGTRRGRWRSSPPASSSGTPASKPSGSSPYPPSLLNGLQWSFFAFWLTLACPSWRRMNKSNAHNANRRRPSPPSGRKSKTTGRNPLLRTAHFGAY